MSPTGYIPSPTFVLIFTTSFHLRSSSWLLCISLSLNILVLLYLFLLPSYLLISLPLPLSNSLSPLLIISVALDDFVLEEKGLLLSRSLPLHPSDLAAGGIGAGVGGVGVGGIGISLNRQPRELSFWISKVRHQHLIYLRLLCVLSIECCPHSEAEASFCITHTSPEPLISLTSQGEEEEAIGFDGEAVVKYVLGRQYARAANIALSSMKKQVSGSCMSIDRWHCPAIDWNVTPEKH